MYMHGYLVVYTSVKNNNYEFAASRKPFHHSADSNKKAYAIGMFPAIRLYHFYGDPNAAPSIDFHTYDYDVVSIKGIRNKIIT